jgi:light-regulated signal transduction histidine kinase (bacteriophytochrome)
MFDAYAASIVETVRQPLLLLNADLHVVMANPAFYAMFQASAVNTERRHVCDLGGAWTDPRLRGSLEEILPASIEVRDFELEQFFEGLGPRTMLLNARRLQHCDSAVRLILLTIEDVTERRRLQRELDERLREVEQRNRELQDFAAIASHDLQEPLRKIQAFAGRLTATCGASLPPDGRDYVERMRDAAFRTTSLIDDLLSLTRVASRGGVFARVDLNQVVTGALGDVAEGIRDTAARLTVGRLPTIHADAAQLRQLFQNLLGNALKFSGVHAPAIFVYAEATPDALRVFVEDNGLGFAPEHAELIFNPFDRAGTRGEYERAGLGLAVCRRIMERHGGTIHADVRADGGARFVVAFRNDS